MHLLGRDTAMTDFLSIVPNLSIGVIAIGALVYTVIIFNKSQTSLIEKHGQAIEKGQEALRQVEADVRRFLTDQLSQNTIALQENTKIMARVIKRLPELDI